MDDLDPPSFQFDRAGSGRKPDEPSPEALEAAEQLVPEAEEEPEQPSSQSRFLPNFSETTSRVLVAIPWVIFAIVIVVAGGLVFALAMIALAILGLRELFRMGEASRPLMLPAYAAVAGMILAAHFGGAFQILLILAATFPAAFAFAAVRESHERITISIAFTLLGVTWLGLGFSHAVLLRDLPLHGGALLIDVLVATFVGDTAAYGAGRLFGNRKISPRISPNKTLEGLVGGFLGGTMGFWLAGLYQDWLPGIDALLMGMCVAAIAPIGDLFASMIKRDLEVKDTGKLFGPHGGLIDRLDAVLFTVVVGYYLSVAFGY